MSRISNFTKWKLFSGRFSFCKWTFKWTFQIIDWIIRTVFASKLWVLLQYLFVMHLRIIGVFSCLLRIKWNEVRFKLITDKNFTQRSRFKEVSEILSSLTSLRSSFFGDFFLGAVLLNLYGERPWRIQKVSAVRTHLKRNLINMLSD